MSKVKGKVSVDLIDVNIQDDTLSVNFEKSEYLNSFFLLSKEILDLTNCFMDEPAMLLVNKDELTLEGIQQFYIDLKQYNWKK